MSNRIQHLIGFGVVAISAMVLASAVRTVGQGSALNHSAAATGFSVFKSGGLAVDGHYTIGAKFTIEDQTTITRIGTFSHNRRTAPAGPKDTVDERVVADFYPSHQGRPDTASLIATYRMTHNGARSHTPVDFAEVNLQLAPGTYYFFVRRQSESWPALLYGKKPCRSDIPWGCNHSGKHPTE